MAQQIARHLPVRAKRLDTRPAAVPPKKHVIVKLAADRQIEPKDSGRLELPGDLDIPDFSEWHGR